MSALISGRCARSVVAVAAVMALGACGGGGGGGANNNDDPQAGVQSTSSLSGVAAKGLLKQARVTAYLPDAKGEPAQKLIDTLTDANGAYNLSGLPVGQVVLLVVSQNTTGPVTTMADEASNQDVPLPEGFTLKAATLIEAPGVSNPSLQITPYSTMAVAKAQAAAKAGGAFDANTVGNANADIRRFAGFDVLSDAPQFSDAGHTPTNAAALALAAVSTLAQGQSETTCAALKDLTDAAAKTAAKAQCTVADLSLAGSSDQALADKLKAAQTKAVADEHYTGAVVLTAAVQPEALKPVPLEDIAAAKSLVAYLRSDAPFVVGTTGDTLRTRLAQVQADVQAAINPLDGANVHLLNAVTYASELYAQREYGVPTSSVSFDGGGRQIGCTFYTDKRYEVEAVDPATRQTLVCRVSYQYQLKTLAQNGQPAVYRALQHAIFLEPVNDIDTPTGVEVDYAVRTSLLWQDGFLNAQGVFDADWANGAHTMLASGGGASPFDSKLVAHVRAQFTNLPNFNDVLTSLSFTGDLAPAYERVAGVIQAKGPKTMADLVITPQSVQAGNVISKVAVQGGFSAVDASGAVSSIKLLEGSLVQGWLTLPDFSYDTLLSKTDDLALHLVLQAVTPAGSVVQGALDVSQFTDTALAAGSGLTPSQRVGSEVNLPASIGFAGVISRGGQQLLSGALQLSISGLPAYDGAVPLQDSAAITLSLVVNARLQVPSRPDAVLKNLTLNQHLGALGITGTVEQGSIWVSAQGTQTPAGVLKLALLSDSGITLALDTSDASGIYPLKKGDKELGAIDSHSGVVSFLDGSYQR